MDDSADFVSIETCSTTLNFDHNIFEGLNVDKSKADVLYRSYEPNEKQRHLCDKLNVPHLLWPAFVVCWNSFNDAEVYMKRLAEHYVTNNPSVFNVLTNLKINVASHDFSEYEGMDLNDLEKTFVACHRKVIPALQKILSDSEEILDFKKHLEFCILYLRTFLETESESLSLEELESEMRQFFG